MKPTSDVKPRAEATRRDFLGWTAAAAASLAAGSAQTAAAAEAADPLKPVLFKKAPSKPAHACPLKLGIASYSFRKFSLEKALAMTKHAGLQYVCLKSFHLPLNALPEAIAAAAKCVADAGLVLYGGGVISMHRPAEVDQGFEYAKAAGMKTIVAMPSVEMLPRIEEKIRQYDIRVAIHNHGPGDNIFPTPQSAYEKIKNMDPRLGLCIDIGHTVRVGADPMRSVEACADRLLDFHMKDVTEASPKGHEIQVGRGVIDIVALLQTLVRVKYAGVLSFEYEPEADDPLPGLCESVGYTRGVLAAV
jgi:sugar phosphate isomerase/epimerase